MGHALKSPRTNQYSEGSSSQQVVEAEALSLLSPSFLRLRPP